MYYIYRISEANKGKTAWNKGKPAWNKGKATPDDVKKKISEANKGKHFASEETRKKISMANLQWKVKHWKLVDGKRVWY